MDKEITPDRLANTATDQGLFQIKVGVQHLRNLYFLPYRSLLGTLVLLLFSYFSNRSIASLKQVISQNAYCLFKGL